MYSYNVKYKYKYIKNICTQYSNQMSQARACFEPSRAEHIITGARFDEHRSQAQVAQLIDIHIHYMTRLGQLGRVPNQHVEFGKLRVQKKMLVFVTNW